MEADDINRLLCGLTAFEMRNSAEGAVLTVRHPDAEPFTQTIRVTPELARLDRVSHAKFLLDRVMSGELTAAEADRELSDLQHGGRTGVRSAQPVAHRGSVLCRAGGL
jgi:uncharacterized membrane protein YjjP (DUF1212 family)